MVFPSELPDENEKLINHLQSLFIQEGRMATWFGQLVAIANQCPYAGGKAVYRARIMISELDTVMDFDDESTCATLGIYREMNLSKGVIESNSVDST